METYLPQGADWYDFWTNERFTGGQTVQKDCPMDILPLYVRAGSIIPLGPNMQYATEKPADPIELRIYRGANGTFMLYEDDNETYDYEKGKRATIPISWNEDAHTLEIGKRSGEFPGMLKERTFHVTWVADGHGAGIPSTKNPDVVVSYKGEAVKVSTPLH